MNKLFTYLILSIFTLISYNSISQEGGFSCGISEQLKKLYEENPKLKEEQLKFLENAKNYRSEKGVDQTVYTIPLVFHVIHQYGSENISDEQIYRQVEILNRDYRMKNSDTSNIVPIFKSLKGDVFLEFKLASKDPQGNCTNGIEHIYSHEAFSGDDNSKLNGWHREQYLNVWVVAKMKEGTAGYSMYPSSVSDGSGFFRDGVIILNSYIGETGTSSAYSSRALTHEIGHWLGLAHPWGDNNSPEQGCKDSDNIDDTPFTAGHLSCTNAYLHEPHCTLLNVHTYTFYKVNTKSGVYDSTYVPTPEQPAQQWNLGKFHAVGVANNPSDSLRFSFSNWDLGGETANNDTTYANLTGAINTSKYYEVTLTPKNGITPTLANIDFTFQRNAKGPRSYAIRSSMDGFASNLVPSSTNSKIKIRENAFYSLKDTVESFDGNHVVLDTTSTFKNISAPVTFRVYAWNAEDATGTFSIDDFVITGTDGVIENTQNYMDYSYCSNMFTKDQIKEMRYAITSDVAGRNNLITPENHAKTGIDVVSPNQCTPVPDFKSTKKYVCVGSSVQFTDVSWRAKVDSRTWTFEGGTPSSSTSSTPSVTYDSPGYKKVTLSVQNESGVNETIRDNYIYVAPNWADFVGPYQNTIDNDKAYYFLTDNPENNESKFQLAYGVGKNNTNCYKLNNYKDVSSALPYTNEWFHSGRLGGNKDALISPSYDLTHTSTITFSFDYAYATNGTLLTTVGENKADILEEVNIYSTKDCGQSWTLKKKISGAELLTGGFAGGNEFTPKNSSQWKSISIPYTATNLDKNTRFKIEFTASDVSNNFYVDNVSVNGVLGLFSNEINALELTVYPNPLTPQETINVSYIAGENPVELILRDVQGKILHSEKIETLHSEVNHTLQLGKMLSASCYFLEVKSGESSVIKKVVVL